MLLSIGPMWHVSFHNCWSDVESFYRLNESIILYSSKIIMANIQLCTNIYEVFHNVRQKKANSKSISKISCSLLCERMTSCHGQRLSFSSVILPLLPIKCLRIATPKKRRMADCPLVLQSNIYIFLAHRPSVINQNLFNLWDQTPSGFADFPLIEQ